MLPPALTRRPATGHQGWCAGKVASGGLKGYTGSTLFEMPCGTKDFHLFERKPRQDAASAQTGIKEYDLSGLSGKALTDRQAEIQRENPGISDPIEKPKDRDAATFFGVGVDLRTNSNTSNSVTVTPIAELKGNIIVYWASPDSKSKAGDGSLRNHENKHAADNIAGVASYNKDAKATTLAVPRGPESLYKRTERIMNSFSESEGKALKNQLLTIATTRDTY